MNTTTLTQPAIRKGKDSLVEAASRIMGRLLKDFPGAVEVKFWDQSHVSFGQGKPAFTLVVRDPAWLYELVMKRSPLVLAEAHFRGNLDFEGDVFDVLRLRKHFEFIKLPVGARLELLRDAWRVRGTSSEREADDGSRAASSRGFLRKHSRASDKEAISFHYDVSNEFYRLWLDNQMVYSCAYFESESESLEQAQANKLEHICRKLRLKEGERLLDIGCGWGAMVCWAAKHYGVRAHGITLSEEQLAFARERIETEGLQRMVTVELLDYRDLQGEKVYDKISSIGMFEHVGLANLAEYNKTVYRVLADGGLFLNHGITHDTEGWHTGVNSAFLQKYVFPDGELDRVSNIQHGMEAAGFEILDVEALRTHYAKTLREWVRRLEGRRGDALKHVDETTFRVWRMYMAASAVEFENGGTGIHQILVGKTRDDRREVPWTRRHFYNPRAEQAQPRLARHE